MLATRSYLISKGMSEDFADKLAKKYITKLEQTSTIFSVMDLFQSSVSETSAGHLTALLRAPTVTLNYQTWSEYQEQLSDRRVQSIVQSAAGYRAT